MNCLPQCGGVGWGGVDVHLCSRLNATLCYVEGCGWGGATRFMYTCVSTHWMLRLCYVDVHSRNTLNATLCCGRKWLRPNFWTYTCKKKGRMRRRRSLFSCYFARNTIAIKRSKLPKSITKKIFTKRYTFRKPLRKTVQNDSGRNTRVGLYVASLEEMGPSEFAAKDKLCCTWHAVQMGIHVWRQCQVWRQFDFEKPEQHSEALMLKKNLLKRLLISIPENTHSNLMYFSPRPSMTRWHFFNFAVAMFHSQVMRLSSKNQHELCSPFYKAPQIPSVCVFTKNQWNWKRQPFTGRGSNRLPSYWRSKGHSTFLFAVHVFGWRLKYWWLVGVSSIFDGYKSWNP